MVSSVGGLTTLVEAIYLADIVDDAKALVDDLLRVPTTPSDDELVHIMSDARAPTDSLPTDLLCLITDHLPDQDLLRLSHAGVPMFNGLLDRDDDFWKKHLSPEDPPSRESAKHRFFTTRFYRFPDPGPNNGRTAIGLPRKVHHICSSVSFTISVRFALDLNPADQANTRMGGTLLGGQYGDPEQRYPRWRRQIITIDPDRNLYCSMIDGGPIVASDLVPDQWYHLVLTFDPLPNANPHMGTQCVYLDGQLLNTTNGSRFQDLHCMINWQLGGGYETPVKRWNGFRGRIQDFTLRRGVLSPDHVQFLAENGELGKPPKSERVAWSLRRDTAEAQAYGEVIRVKHGRPLSVRVGGPQTGVCGHPVDGGLD